MGYHWIFKWHQGYWITSDLSLVLAESVGDGCDAVSAEALERETSLLLFASSPFASRRLFSVTFDGHCDVKPKPCIVKETLMHPWTHEEKWPLYVGGIGAADIFPRQANMSVSLAHTVIPIFHLFSSRPITTLNTGRVSLTNTGLYVKPRKRAVTVPSLWSLELNDPGTCNGHSTRILRFPRPLLLLFYLPGYPLVF